MGTLSALPPSLSLRMSNDHRVTDIQRSAKRIVRGCEKFLPALA